MLELFASLVPESPLTPSSELVDQFPVTILPDEPNLFLTNNNEV